MIILYKENPKDFTKKIAKLLHKFSNVTGYKMNIPKCVGFLNTNNEVAEREIKESTPLTIA